VQVAAAGLVVGIGDGTATAPPQWLQRAGAARPAPPACCDVGALA